MVALRIQTMLMLIIVNVVTMTIKQIKILLTRILGPILVSYVYEEKGTYWLFGLCATSLLATGIVTSVAYRCSSLPECKV